MAQVQKSVAEVSVTPSVVVAAPMPLPLSPAEIKRQEMEAKRLEERRIVRGKFIFHELPGGKMEFNYLCYKGDPLEKFSFKDGEIYEIPLGVARHLNTNCWYPLYAHNDKASIALAGSAITSITEKIRRCSFQSLDFTGVA